MRQVFHGLGPCYCYYHVDSSEDLGEIEEREEAKAINVSIVVNVL